MLSELAAKLRQADQWMQDNGIQHVTGAIFQKLEGDTCGACSLGALYGMSRGKEGLPGWIGNENWNSFLEEFGLRQMSCLTIGGRKYSELHESIIWTLNDGHYIPGKYMRPAEIADYIENSGNVTEQPCHEDR